MTRVVAVLAAGGLLVGCGGGSTTTIVKRQPSTTAATTNSSTSGVQPANSLSLQGVEACLDQAGASTQPPKRLREGEIELSAIMPNGSTFSVAIAPHPAVAEGLSRRFSNRRNYNVSTVPGHPDVLVVFQGSVDPSDRALASRCLEGN